ncbi:shikimate dehydrogenase family protein [Streptomyces zhihengii]
MSGTTRLYAVLGDPVAQVQAPAMLNPLFTRLGTDAILVPVHVRPGDLDTTVPGLQRVRNLDGLLITVPHKADCLRFADEISPAARLSGSANALRRGPDGRWYADNFDGAGFVRGLRAAGHRPETATVCVAGAGERAPPSSSPCCWPAPGSPSGTPTPPACSASWNASPPPGPAASTGRTAPSTRTSPSTPPPRAAPGRPAPVRPRPAAPRNPRRRHRHEAAPHRAAGGGGGVRPARPPRRAHARRTARPLPGVLRPRRPRHRRSGAPRDRRGTRPGGSGDLITGGWPPLAGPPYAPPHASTHRDRHPPA